MIANRVSRRTALTAMVLPALLAACGGPSGPVHYEPLSWDYLPRLKLDVASIDIDDSWTPVSGRREKGFLAPTPPVEALHRMAEDRLVATGTSGRAEFSVIDASIVQDRQNYVGKFAVRLAIVAADGGRRGYAEARVSRTKTIDDDSGEGARRELYQMVQQMMNDMNVEFEYQIRHSLGDYLQTTAKSAPGPAAVEQQNLEAPAEAEPTLAPPAASPAAPAVPSAVPFSSPAPTPLTR